MTDITETVEKITIPEIKAAYVKTTAPGKAKTKKLSKSKRTHIRRMKAEARKEGVVYRPGIE